MAEKDGDSMREDGGECAIGSVLYRKGEAEADDNDMWDDTALIEAYNKAITVAYDQVRAQIEEEGEEVPEFATQPKKATEKKKKARTKKGRSVKNWSAGELCMAPYSEDGEYYKAQVVSVDAKKQSALVCYDGYEEEETHALSALRLVSDFEGKDEVPLECAENGDHNLYEQGVSQTQYPDGNFPMSHGNHAGVAGSSGIGLIPTFPPPPPPAALLASNTSAPSSPDALSTMLMSWYMTGYHSGYYQAMQDFKKGNGRQE